MPGEQGTSGSQFSTDNPLNPDFTLSQGVKSPRYSVYLGGINYGSVTERTRHVVATMPLVMDRIAKAVCAQGIGTTGSSGKLGVDVTSGDAEEIADELHRRLCSRPIDSTTQHNVDAILAEGARCAKAAFARA